MDLTQLANLGEFIGGVAVLVTWIGRLRARDRFCGAVKEGIAVYLSIEGWEAK